MEPGNIIAMTVLGGAGLMFGPVLGVGLYPHIEDIASTTQTLTISFTGIVLVRDFGLYWHSLLGLVFVVVVWVVPNGLWGILTRSRELAVGLGSKIVNRVRLRSGNGGDS